jgi:DDE family transposase
MGLMTVLQECCQAVRELLPELARPEQTALGRLVCGVVGSESAQLSRASAAAPGEAQDRSKQRRAQRLVANERLDVGRAQRRLLERVLRGRRGRVDLLLDATTTGATAHQAGTVTLCLALRWHGRAVPLVWRTWVADAPGQHWTRAIPELCAVVAEHLPDTARVVLLADRGLGNVGLARTAHDLGWHYLVRVQRRTRVRLPDGTVHEIGRLVEAPTPGESDRARRGRERAGCIDGAAVGAARRQRGPTWESDWDAALPTNVVAIAGPSPDDPWLLLTDLPAAPARCREYRHRTQEEELFRDLKSFGWQWQDSRLRLPDRVDRLLLVLVLATLWIDALAQHVLRHDLRHLLEDRSRHCYSRFQLGLRWLRRSLVNGLHVPCSFCLPPDRRHFQKLS